MYADSWKQLAKEEAWLRPREDWDPQLVWVLRAFLAEQGTRFNKKNSPSYLSRSPRFFVVVKDELRTTASGINGWNSTIVPLLTKLTGVGIK